MLTQLFKFGILLTDYLQFLLMAVNDANNLSILRGISTRLGPLNHLKPEKLQSRMPIQLFLRNLLLLRRDFLATVTTCSTLSPYR